MVVSVVTLWFDEAFAISDGSLDGSEERDCLFVPRWDLNTNFLLSVTDTAVYLPVPLDEYQARDING
jgi:hypothetical protein